jgi:hypothetical protein
LGILVVFGAVAVRLGVSRQKQSEKRVCVTVLD